MKRWPTKLLGELSESVMGQAPPGSECNIVGKGTPFVKAGEFGEQHPIIREWTTKPLKFAKSSDVLVCVVGATCGKLNLGADCAIGRSVAAIRPNSSVLNQRFLYAFLQGWTLRLRSGSQGSAQGVITREMIGSIPMPVPPLAEQERIVKLLDEADELRKLRAQADRRSADLIPALFHEMFGDPVANPKGFRKEPLEKLIRVKSGNFLPAKDMDVGGEFPVYGGNGINGYHSKFMFKQPIIVIGRVGVYCGVVHLSEPKSWVTDNALYVSEEKEYFDQQYLAAALRLANLNQYAGRAAQPLVSGNRIYPVPILVPPLQLQQEFAQRVSEIRELQAAQAASRERTEHLFQSMLHRAFNQEL